MLHDVSWWIKGGADLRTETGNDSIEYMGELSVEMAEEILTESLKDFSTAFANEHYLIECGVWDFGVSGVNVQPVVGRKIDWVAEWSDAKYMHETGMSKTYLKREMICPDCGGELWKNYAIHPDHFVYQCQGTRGRFNGCSIMLKDKRNKTSWKCREW